MAPLDLALRALEMIEICEVLITNETLSLEVLFIQETPV